jgi:hypothetical protein
VVYVNFFQPQMKLREKTRQGAKVTRHYDLARTPLKRLLGSDALSPASTGRSHRATPKRTRQSSNGRSAGSRTTLLELGRRKVKAEAETPI